MTGRGSWAAPPYGVSLWLQQGLGGYGSPGVYLRPRSNVSVVFRHRGRYRHGRASPLPKRLPWQRVCSPAAPWIRPPCSAPARDSTHQSHTDGTLRAVGKRPAIFTLLKQICIPLRVAKSTLGSDLTGKKACIYITANDPTQGDLSFPPEGENNPSLESKGI